MICGKYTDIAIVTVVTVTIVADIMSCFQTHNAEVTCTIFQRDGRDGDSTGFSTTFCVQEMDP